MEMQRKTRIFDREQYRSKEDPQKLKSIRFDIWCVTYMTIIYLQTKIQI